jgi:hypothetical protein
MTEGELVLNAQRAGDAAEEDVSGMTRAEAAFYQRVHAPAELRTFHCEKVRKMLLSGLDPSMLLGFVCRHEGEWVGLRWRIALVRFWASSSFLSMGLIELRSCHARSL